MSKEILIPHDELRDNETIRTNMENHFKAHGLDLHVNEVLEFEDDHKKGVRVIKAKNTKYFYSK